MVMHAETREADIEAVMKAAKKYKKNSWKQASEMRDVVWEKGQDAYFCDILWELFRTGQFDFSDKSDFFWYLTYSERESFSADDFVSLYLKICSHPKDALKHSGPARDWSSNPPGYIDYLYKILAKRRGDEAFIARVAERRGEFPKAMQDGIAFMMAGFGAVPAEALPKGTLDHAAALFASPSGWGDEGRIWKRSATIWPEEVWGRACVDAALKNDSVNKKAFRMLKSWATPAEAIQIGRGLSRHDLEPAILKLGWSEAEHLDALIAAGRNALGKVEPIDTYRWRSGFLLLALADVAKKRETELPADLDALYVECFKQSMPAHVNQQYAPDFYTLLLERLTAVIPAKRLEKLALASSAPKTGNWANDEHFPLLTVGTSKALMTRAIDRAKHLSSRAADSQKRAAINTLVHFGEDVIEPLTEAFDKAPNEVFLTTLEEVGGAKAIPGLVIGLQAKAKGLREQAQRVLSTYTSAALLPHLSEPMLKSRRKDARLAFATILATIAWTPEIGALAAKAVEKERAAAVRDLLEPLARRVETAGDDTDGLGAKAQAKAVEKLEESDGKGWKKVLKKHGAATFDICTAWFGAYVRGQDQKSRYSWIDLEAWQAILTHFKDEAHARDAALAMVPLFANLSSANDYFEMLPKVWPDSVESFQGLLKKTKFKHREAIYRSLARMDASDALYDALVLGVADGSKSVREAVEEALREHQSDADIVKQAARLLSDRSATVRKAAAGMITGVSEGKGAALEPLRKALAKEKDAKVKTAITEVIAECEAEAFSLTRFEPRTAETDKALDKALAGLEALPPKMPLKKTPKVRFKTGKALSKGALAWFIGRVAEEGPEVRDENLWGVRARLDDEDCAKLCDAMIAPSRDPLRDWPVYVQAVIGGERHLDALGQALDGMARDRRYNFGHDVREALVRSGSNIAVRWLEHWSRRGCSNTMRGRLPGDLARMASEAGISVEELQDRAMGHFGFDQEGVQEVEYGGKRTLTLRLGPENELLIESEGKLVKSPPGARKGEDAAAIKAAKKEISTLKKDLKRIHTAQVLRLERACASGRLWEREAWEERFLRHPIMHAYTRRLIFQTVDASGEGPIFVVTDEGELLDVEAEPVELRDAVRIAHPIDMDAEGIEAWTEMMDDLGRSTPFDLLGRPIYTEHTPEALLEGRAPGEAARVMNGFKKLGYVDGPREDGGHIYHSYGAFADISVTLSHSGFAPESLSWLETIEIQQVSIQRAGEAFPWAEVPPRIASEIRHDLMRLTDAIE